MALSEGAAKAAEEAVERILAELKISAPPVMSILHCENDRHL
jgi:hypothetical protein